MALTMGLVAARATGIVSPYLGRLLDEPDGSVKKDASGDIESTLAERIWLEIGRMVLADRTGG